jgi:outer membrane protein assembly factor BamB
MRQVRLSSSAVLAVSTLVLATVVALTGGPSASAAPPNATPNVAPGVTGAMRTVTPARLLDTRNGTGLSAPTRVSPVTGPVTFQVAGRAGVPTSGAAAVMLTVTAVNASATGFLVAYPGGSSLPSTSNVNFVAGQTVANSAIVRLGSTGSVTIYAGADTDVLADVTGYFLAGPDAVSGTLTTLPAPARWFDSRTTIGTYGGPIAPGGHLALNAASEMAMANEQMSMIVLNVTVTTPTAPGFLTVSASGAPVPTVSNLNFSAGQTTANLVFARVGPDGYVVFTNSSPGSVQIVLDITGYFMAYLPDNAGAMRSTTPYRLLDTRFSAPVAGRSSRTVRLSAADGTPLEQVTAAALNVTATNTRSDGFVTVYPTGVARPETSSLNFKGGENVPDLVVAAVGADGSFVLYNGSADPIDIVVDVFGVVVDRPAAPAPNPDPPNPTVQFSQHAGNAAQTGSLDGVGLSSPLALAWQTSPSLTTAFTPVFGDGAVFTSFGFNDGRPSFVVTAIRQSDGQPLWGPTAVGGGGAVRMVYGAGTLFVVTGVCDITALSSHDGSVQWQSPSPSATVCDTTPVLSGGVLYFGGNPIIARSASDGHVLWTKSVGYAAAVAVDDGVLVASSGVETVTALDPLDGSQRWQHSDVLTSDTGQPSISIANGRVYAIDEHSQVVHVLDLATGDLVTSFRSDLPPQVDAAHGVVITRVDIQPGRVLCSGGCVVTARSTTTYDVLWTFSGNGYYDGEPLIVDGTVYLTAGTMLYGLNGQTGAIQWSFQKPPASVNNSGGFYNLSAGNGILVASAGNGLLAFRTASAG